MNIKSHGSCVFLVKGKKLLQACFSDCCGWREASARLVLEDIVMRVVVRARFTHVRDIDRPTTFLFNLECETSQEKQMLRLKNNEGIVISICYAQAHCWILFWPVYRWWIRFAVQSWTIPEPLKANCWKTSPKLHYTKQSWAVCSQPKDYDFPFEC